jgi:RNA polymerase sigma factor (sigma-70 family)
MASRSLGDVSLKHLQTLYRVGAVGGLTDGQLLERFVAGHGEAAEAGFAALVERHGPMVLRVCRQILDDPHDAQDAFQATFLVLVRRAVSVRKSDSLACWLYGVARRVASRARADAARRRTFEQRVASTTGAGTVAEGECADPWAELHEEIARLPERYRVSVVLCYLEGLTAEAAARRLGCPRGTVLSRLSRARERLRERLTRRGLAVPAGLSAAGLSPDPARAEVPAALAHSVVQAATWFAAGATGAGVVPASAAALTEGVLRMMVLTRLKGIAGAVLAAGLLSVGISVLVHRTAGAPPQDGPPGETAKPAPAVGAADNPARKGKGGSGELIVRAADMGRGRPVDSFMGMVAIDRETATWRTIFTGPSHGPLSPDGRYIVCSRVLKDPGEDGAGVWVYDTQGASPPRRIFERKGEPFWSDGGRRVVIGVPVGERYDRFETWRVNADGTGRTRLPIPETDLVLDCSQDGTWLATRTISGEPAHRGRLTLVHPDGTGARVLTEGSAKDDLFSVFKIAPDGRNVAYVEVKTEDKVRKCRLFVVDIEGKNRREIPVAFEHGTIVIPFWSPDGSRLALNLFNDRESSIALVGLDGSDFRKLALPPGRWNLHICDWKAIAPLLRVIDENLDGVAAGSPRGRYEALLRESQKVLGESYQEILKARTAEERDRISREWSRQRRSYAERFLEIAESAPGDSAAVDALVWVAVRGHESPESTRAIDLLAERHAGRPKVGEAALSVSLALPSSQEKLLRAVVEKGPNRNFKGNLWLALGRNLKRQAEQIRKVREDPEQARWWEVRFVEHGSGKEGFAQFVSRDPDALMKEAEAVFELTIAEFGDMPGGRGTLGDEARSELFEIRELRVGKPAPEIEGEDVDGQPLRLSDFRGKVVVVTFWADWCGSGRNQYEAERSLVQRMQGRPFALLGVNGDGDREKLRELIRAKGINWRSWWDGGGSANTPGPIARRYNVDGWPTLYVLDHRGVIRHKHLSPGTQRLDEAIEALVKAAEEEGAGVPKGDGPG